MAPNGTGLAGSFGNYIRQAFPKDEAVNNEFKKAQSIGALIIDTLDKTGNNLGYR